MNLKCYQLKAASLVTAIPWHGLQALNEGSNLGFAHWIEVDNPTVEELEEGLQHLNLHPLILEDCFDPEHGTLVDRFPGAVYIELPANENGMFREVSYLSIICLPRLLVTIRRGEIPKFDTFVTTLQNDLPLESGNTSNLLYLIINFIIDKTTVRSLFYRKQLSLLERKLVQNSEELDPEEMTMLNHQITQLESICEDQLLCVGSLVSHNDVVIETSGQEAYFQDLINDAEHSLRVISRLNGRLKDLQNNFEILHHEETEKRLRILTIISAIFLPLSFMTGFFGMNFVSMSVYQWLYGFPSFLAAMVIIPLAMMWYFRSRGWLD